MAGIVSPFYKPPTYPYGGYGGQPAPQQPQGQMIGGSWYTPPTPADIEQTRIQSEANAATQQATRLSDQEQMRLSIARNAMPQEGIGYTSGPEGTTIYGGGGGGAGLPASLSGLRGGAGGNDLDKMAKLQQEAEARRMGQVSDLFGRLTGGGGGGAPGGGGVAGNEQAARDAAFGRAKERSGRIARSSLESLYNETAGHGQSGSRVEQGLASGMIERGAGDLQDFTREQMIQDLGRSAQVADRDYAGNLTTRAQNLGIAPSLLAMITQRAY